MEEGEATNRPEAWGASSKDQHHLRLHTPNRPAASETDVSPNKHRMCPEPDPVPEDVFEIAAGGASRPELDRASDTMAGKMVRVHAALRLLQNARFSRPNKSMSDRGLSDQLQWRCALLPPLPVQRVTGFDVERVFECPVRYREAAMKA